MCVEFSNSWILLNHMESQYEIPQIDGNQESESGNCFNQHVNDEDNLPEKWPNEDLEDFVIKCKVCGMEFDGKSLYNFHIDTTHGCNVCRSQADGAHHICLYRDFIVV